MFFKVVDYPLMGRSLMVLTIYLPHWLILSMSGPSRQLRAAGIGVAPGGPGEASAVRSIRGPGGVSDG